MSKRWGYGLAGILLVAVAVLVARAASPHRLTAEPVVTTVTTDELLAQARERLEVGRYEYATEQGTEIVPTDDGHSFALVWTPEGFDEMPEKTVLVDLHGHGSWAFDGVYLWKDIVEARGYGLVALQWWFGEDEDVDGYYSPAQMYDILEPMLIEMGATHVILHGFSRGSANTYALALADRVAGRNLFDVVIANAGPMAEDFPLNARMLNGEFGKTPLKDTQWILYCGMLDEDGDVCQRNETTREYLEALGGRVLVFMKDYQGDHGGFQRSIANVTQALDVAAQYFK